MPIWGWLVALGGGAAAIAGMSGKGGGKIRRERF